MSRRFNHYGDFTESTIPESINRVTGTRTGVPIALNFADSCVRISSLCHVTAESSWFFALECDGTQVRIVLPGLLDHVVNYGSLYAQLAFPAMFTRLCSRDKWGQLKLFSLRKRVEISN